MAVRRRGGEALGRQNGFAGDPVGGGLALLGDVIGQRQNTERAGAGEQCRFRQAGHVQGNRRP